MICSTAICLLLQKRDFETKGSRDYQVIERLRDQVIERLRDRETNALIILINYFLISQRQGIQKRIFEFAYHGHFNVEMWKERRDLGLQSVELCMGTHGYKYALIKIAKKKRTSQVQKIFESHDREVTPGMQIKLTNLPNEPAMVSFGPGHEFMALYVEP